MYTEYMYKDSLAHHGILGQKWGVRRFQNPDGTLTPEGRARYGVKSTDSSVTKKVKTDLANMTEDQFRGKYRISKAKYMKRVDKYGDPYQHKIHKKKYEEAYRNYARHPFSQKHGDNFSIAKTTFKDDKIKAKIERPDYKKSKRVQQFEKQYQNKGLSKKEAELAAYKRVKTEKIIAATAMIAVASLGAYAAYKHYDKVVDKVIDPKTVLHKITNTSDIGVEDAFYASYKNKDVNKYKGLLGKSIKSTGKHAYDVEVGLKDKVKVASLNSGKNVLSDLAKNDKNFKNDLTNHIKDYKYALDLAPEGQFTKRQKSTFRKAIKSLEEGKIDDNVYKAYNFTLAGRNATGRDQDLSNKFFKELKDKGYGALADINDKELSDYRTKSAMLVIGNKNNLSVKDAKQIPSAEIGQRYLNEIHKSQMKGIGKQVSGRVAIAAGASAIGTVNTTHRFNKIVSNYRKEHPGTKLSYNEILKMELVENKKKK